MGHKIQGRATGRVYEPADHELTRAELDLRHHDVVDEMLRSIATDDRFVRSLLHRLLGAAGPGEAIARRD